MIKVNLTELELAMLFTAANMDNTRMSEIILDIANQKPVMVYTGPDTSLEFNKSLAQRNKICLIKLIRAWSQADQEAGLKNSLVEAKEFVEGWFKLNV